jgi:hypothetical protein
MPNPTYPLSALKNATSIGNPWDKIEVKMGMMPGPPALQGLAKAMPAVKRIVPVAEKLGEVMAEYTPIGGEAMYNVDKFGRALQRSSIAQQLPKEGWEAFKKYVSK